MFASRILAVVLAVFVSAGAFAQAAPETGAAPGAAAAAMPYDCTAQQPRHDHGAEKGTPSPMMKGCAMSAPATASATKAKSKAKAGHDHARTHKLM